MDHNGPNGFHGCFMEISIPWVEDDAGEVPFRFDVGFN